MKPFLEPDYRLVFEKSSGCYLILDTALSVVAASDAYCRAVRKSRDSLLGRDMLDLAGADGASRDALQASLARVLKNRRPDAMPVQRWDVVEPDGKSIERHWSPLNVPLVEGGQVRWIIHRVHDVTQSVHAPETAESERRMAREQDLIIARLRSANEELAQLDNLRQDMLGMSRANTIALTASALAHDMAQPLTAARNYLNALRRNWPQIDDTRVLEVIGKISAQIDRTGEIVKGLRALMAAGATPHKPEAVSAMAGAAAKLAAQAFARADARLLIDIAPDLPDVAVDRTQILQLLVSLLENAAQATEGCTTREVRLAARLDGGTLCLAVADTGVGLPPEIAQLLAEPFAATRLIGSGLGLPIARQVAKLHDGTLMAAPNTPVGTIFTVTMPLKAPEVAPAGRSV
jgi:two-component system sensor kinase FixL